jgi:arsenate reductase
MAEGFLRSLAADLEVCSAGTRPSSVVNPAAVQVMKEIGIDIGHHRPKDVGEFLNDSFDWVITVCDDAERNCPSFAGHVKRRLHLAFPDPAQALGTPDEVLAAFRKVRDQIKAAFGALWERELSPRQDP